MMIALTSSYSLWVVSIHYNVSGSKTRSFEVTHLVLSMYRITNTIGCHPNSLISVHLFLSFSVLLIIKQADMAKKEYHFKYRNGCDSLDRNSWFSVMTFNVTIYGDLTGFIKNMWVSVPMSVLWWWNCKLNLMLWNIWVLLHCTW